MHSKKLLTILLICLTYIAVGQSYFYPLERSYLLSREKNLYHKSSTLHTSIQPYFYKETSDYFTEDSLANGVQYNIRRNNFWNRTASNFLNSYLVKIDTGNVHLRAALLFDLEMVKDVEAKDSYYRNTRGLILKGDLGKQFSFVTGFYENQASFAGYVNRFIDSFGVIPGQGLTKPFKDGSAQDFVLPFGYICYAPSKYITIQFGQDKNFIGNGYRSLLLSDNSMNAPNVKLMSSFWKIKYMVLYQQFLDTREQNAGALLGKGYPRKFATMHYLSWKATRSLELGFFDAVIWQASDSTNQRGFDIAYLNPVIFLRPAEFYNGSADNALMGINVKYSIRNNWYVYGQFILDDMKFNELKKKDSRYPQKYGFQIGTRVFDIAKIKGLAVQGEINYVTPYTYTHRLSRQGYTHYNQSLAHVQNANFWEWVGIVDYNKNRWSLHGRMVRVAYGADTSAATNWGHNVLADIQQYPNYYQGDVKMLQGVRTDVTFLTGTVAYILNPTLNMRVEGSVTIRIQEQIGKPTEENIMVGIGLKTALFNKYYDF
ncbi:MAG: capsule assembly Wzi family protein [Cytophagaceae bacterium]|jgi:hypothetical protein|nr:capsule assembly Wzi family protein [Cytophagaceae bacterium]